MTEHGSGTLNSPANGLNQLTSLGAASISHDAKGNVTHDPTTGYSFGYPPENLLTTVTTPYYNGWLTYDGLNRLASAGAGPSTGFSYDGNSRVAEYRIDQETGSATQTARYVFGPGEDEPLVSFEGPNLEEMRYLHADERGSIIAKSYGWVYAVGRYDEYGRTQSFVSRFGFAGMPYETVSDLYYARARMYNPRGGPRFMQPDPIGYGDGMNMYNRTKGDPVNFTDPTGLEQRCFTFRAQGSAGADANGDIFVQAGRLVTECYDTGGGRGGGGGGGGGRPIPKLEIDPTVFQLPVELTFRGSASEFPDCKLATPNVAASLDVGVFLGYGGGFSLGVNWDTNTGVISAFVSARAGTGLGLIGGTGIGLFSSSPTSDISSSYNFNVAAGVRGGGASVPSGGGRFSSNIGVSVGPQYGFEVSRTQSLTKTATLVGGGQRLCRAN